jgi:hypothetical protein
MWGGRGGRRSVFVMGGRSPEFLVIVVVLGLLAAGALLLFAVSSPDRVWLLVFVPVLAIGVVAWLFLSRGRTA